MNKPFSILVLMLALPVAAQAQPTFGAAPRDWAVMYANNDVDPELEGPAHGGRPPHHQAKHPGGELPPYLAKLELSEQQKTAIKALIKTTLGEPGAKRDEFRDAVREQHKLSFSSEFSEDAAAKLIDNQLAEQRRAMLQKAKLDNGIFKLLTSEQQQAMLADMAKRDH
ncbi:Spy/CpxP family protein refolding chaperone [Methylomonas sp. MED-D]|uniref:Spy/CpxP family protein refolding chaperone n=1 Tax=unclassified Methylomonas TaxID=2608980 RepID=UPI0028A416DA|nr:Spy/CpxP family protein refolding chaperone [Methylomonas sp. MV1]MDT4328751.1 Spy/CpxP family protein refolding chaperone [Methylomonas sp. MV1]